MANSFIIKMWIKSKTEELERAWMVADTEEELDIIQGKLEILKEFYEDFNLESVDTREVIFHNNF